jgi:hypothetical protein
VLPYSREAAILCLPTKWKSIIASRQFSLVFIYFIYQIENGCVVLGAAAKAWHQ